MRKIGTTRAMAFIVVLSIVAFCIHRTQSHSAGQQRMASVSPSAQQQQEDFQKQQATTRQAAEDAAAKRAAFLTRYLDTSVSRTPGIKSLALVVGTEDGKIDRTIGTVLANHFKTDGVTISTSVFKPEFVSDKLFTKVFDGSTGVLNQLQLANSFDALLLARLTIQYSTSAALNNVMTAHVRLEVQLVPIAPNIQNQTWTFTANGPGFSRGEALSMAEERLANQINDDTKMSLGF